MSKQTPEVSAKIIAARQREAKALELRKAGASYEAIASALGYYGQGSAYKAVARALSRITESDAAELRLIEAERLGDLYRITMEILERRHPIMHNGEPVKDPRTGQPFDDDAVRLKAINTLRQLSESYRALLGLDAPAKVDLSGQVQVVTVDQLTAEIARVEAELAELERGSTPDGPT